MIDHGNPIPTLNPSLYQLVSGSFLVSPLFLGIYPPLSLFSQTNVTPENNLVWNRDWWWLICCKPSVLRAFSSTSQISSNLCTKCGMKMLHITLFTCFLSKDFWIFSKRFSYFRSGSLMLSATAWIAPSCSRQQAIKIFRWEMEIRKQWKNKTMVFSLFVFFHKLGFKFSLV